MILRTKTRGAMDGQCEIAHLSMEINRFSKFYYDHGGEMEAFVSSIDLRRSPISQGGLEIPIVLNVFDIFKRKSEILLY